MTLAAVQVAAWGRYVRAALLEELGREHLRTARAKGLSETIVLMRHAAPNAISPLVGAALAGGADPGGGGNRHRGGLQLPGARAAAANLRCEPTTGRWSRGSR